MKKFKIVLVHSHNFTAILIQFGMWLYCLLRGLKYEKIYNHLEIEIDGICWGARSKGVIPRFREEMESEFNHLETKDYSFNITDKQYKILKSELKRLKGIKYQKINFLQHAIEILAFIWIGKTKEKALDRIYCTELGFYLLDKLDIIKTNYWSINPYDAKQLLDEHTKRK